MRDSQVRDATEKIRLFVQAPLAAGAPLPLTGDQAHYLGGVRRLKVGDAILVFNGLDGEWRASVAELGRGAGRLVVSEKTRAQSSAPDVWLVQALIKRGPLELVAEKAVELGAARIQLVTTDYSQRRAANLRRLRAIAIEAAEQCGRLEVPKIAEAAALPLCLGEWPGGTAAPAQRRNRRRTPVDGRAGRHRTRTGGDPDRARGRLFAGRTRGSRRRPVRDSGISRPSHLTRRDGCPLRTRPVAGAGRRLAGVTSAAKAVATMPALAILVGK